jgi:hypothetical protein
MAQAQALAPSSAFDRVRAAGFWWRGALDGRIAADVDLPIAVDELRIGNTEDGWFGEADVALGARHRVRFTGSNRVGNDDTTLGTFINIGPLHVPVQVPISSDVRIRQLDASYNFLVVRGPGVDAGILAGIGYFDTAASVTTPLGGVGAELDTPFPNLGGNALLNPGGSLRGYVEVTGFPRVEVDDFSGWVLNISARAEYFVTRHVGVTVGYRTYRIDVRDKTLSTDFDLRWGGLVFGVSARF